MTGSFMIEIQCPHCGKDVELEDGASGLFDCPYCSEVFEYTGTEILDEDLELIDEMSPGVIRTTGSFLYVLMPMRVSQ